MRTSSTRRLGAVSLAALLALFTFASPAFAGDKSADKSADKKAASTERPAVSGSNDDDSRPDTNADAPPPEGDNMHPSGKDRHEDKGPQGHSLSDPDGDENGGADKPFLSQDGAGGVDTADQDGNNGCGNDDDFEDDNNGNCGPKVKAAGETPPPPAKCVDDMDTSKDECDDEEVLSEVIEKCPKTGDAGAGDTTEMKDGCATSTTKTETAVNANTLASGAVAGTSLDTPASVLGVVFERTIPAAAAPAGAATTPAAVAAGAATAPAGTTVLGAVLARTGLSFTVLALAIALGLLAVGIFLKRAGRTTSDI